MPENGVVGSIAVDLITEQLGVEQKRNVLSETFPPVATFGDGWVRDLVRVYAGTDPDVLIPHCDVALPMTANADLAVCVVNDLAADFDRVIVLTAIPPRTKAEVGEVTGLVTSEEAAAELRDAEIPLVSFDVDTQKLAEQADEIRNQTERIARHYEQLMEGQDPLASDEGSMYQ